MKSIIKNIKFLLFPIIVLFNQDLNAQKTTVMEKQKTTVTCENKSDSDVTVMLMGKRILEELKVKSKGSSSKELIGILQEADVVEDIAEKTVGVNRHSAFYRVVGEAFKKDLEEKYTTGPRTVKITITNDKITTILTDSTGQNPETITTDIKPPLEKQKTTVSCENKSDLDVTVILLNNKEEELEVKTKGSGNKEMIGHDFLQGALVVIEEIAEKTVGTKIVTKGYKNIGTAFSKKLEGKYATGPRTVKITITNDKITTTLTDSTGQNPETITTDIKPPLK